MPAYMHGRIGMARRKDRFRGHESPKAKADQETPPAHVLATRAACPRLWRMSQSKRSANRIALERSHGRAIDTNRRTCHAKRRDDARSENVSGRPRKAYRRLIASPANRRRCKRQTRVAGGRANGRLDAFNRKSQPAEVRHFVQFPPNGVSTRFCLRLIWRELYA